MVGGNSDAALRRAVRYADVWQGLPASVDAFAERVRRLTELAGGRDVAVALRIGWDRTVPVEHFADELLAYREVGATQLAVHFGEREGTLGQMEALVDALREG